MGRRDKRKLDSRLSLVPLFKSTVIGGIISCDFRKMNYAMKSWIYMFWILNLNDRIEELILIFSKKEIFFIKCLNYEKQKIR